MTEKFDIAELKREKAECNGDNLALRLRYEPLVLRYADELIDLAWGARATANTLEIERDYSRNLSLQLQAMKERAEVAEEALEKMIREKFDARSAMKESGNG